MAVFLLCAWILFMVAFMLVRLFFPSAGVGTRRISDIKNRPVYDDDGYDVHGFSPLGYHRNGTRYDDDGYDRNGLDINGDPRPDQPQNSFSGPGGQDPSTAAVSGSARVKIVAVVMAVVTVVLVGVAAVDYTRSLTCLFGHNYIRTFCEKPEVCSRCGLEKDHPAGHLWMHADCEHAKTCSFCRKQEGEPLGHDVDSATGLCRRCHKKTVQKEQDQ